MKKHSASLRFLFNYGEIIIIFCSLFSLGCWCESGIVVVKLFCMFYSFNKDDYQIYPQYIKWCSFLVLRAPFYILGVEPLV